MNTEIKHRACLACNKLVKGRTDKKFCNDYCRNLYNNNLKAGNNNRVRNINNALSRNRRILENILGDEDEIAKTSKEKLLQMGFRFKYCTHVHMNAKGNRYVYCYDHGYLLLNEEECLVVKETPEPF